jgi:hypothetical protein
MAFSESQKGPRKNLKLAKGWDCEVPLGEAAPIIVPRLGAVQAAMVDPKLSCGQFVPDMPWELSAPNCYMSVSDPSKACMPVRS